MDLKVLIVENSAVARSFLGRAVAESFSNSVVITEVGDLSAARKEISALSQGKQLDNEKFKLILVDLELPDSNGLSLLTELAQYTAIKIVTTLYADDEHLFPALQCGANGYLLKEDRVEVLVEELQKIVRGQPPLSPAIARRLLSHFQQSPELLSSDQTQVLTHLSKGFTSKEIARLLSMKWLAVNEHIQAIYKKVNGNHI
jgi:two-component system, NarL family, nitrate/nitrite response regulator NarL